MPFDYGVERRSNMLAEAMQRRVDMFAQQLRPAGQRPPFTQQLNEENALKFWRAHRYDDMGARVLQNMPPQSIAELDAALSQHVEQQQSLLPQPQAPAPPPPPPAAPAEPMLPPQLQPGGPT